MDAWTPPVIVSADQEVTVTSAAPHWRFTRGDSGEAPLSLVRPDGVFLTIDFTAGKARHRTTESGKGAQMLSKALGVRQFLKKHGRYPVVVDATGGLGGDAWALASLGCLLTVIEQHTAVHALLADGLTRALADSHCAVIAQRISLIHGDATLMLKQMDADRIDAVYLDPMYPEKRRKASNKKGMQFLQALLGPPAQEDASLLLSALASGASRVAVKRPKGAPFLAGTDQFMGQRTVIASPNTRYDVYHCHQPEHEPERLINSNK